ncbi:MAG: hypothetical protein AB7T49_21060 [Oligoflexales bacterium]
MQGRARSIIGIILIAGTLGCKNRNSGASQAKGLPSGEDKDTIIEGMISGLCSPDSEDPNPADLLDKVWQCVSRAAVQGNFNTSYYDVTFQYDSQIPSVIRGKQVYEDGQVQSVLYEVRNGGGIAAKDNHGQAVLLRQLVMNKGVLYESVMATKGVFVKQIAETCHTNSPMGIVELSKCNPKQ